MRFIYFTVSTNVLAYLFIRRLCFTSYFWPIYYFCFCTAWHFYPLQTTDHVCKQKLECPGYAHGDFLTNERFQKFWNGNHEKKLECYRKFGNGENISRILKFTERENIFKDSKIYENGQNIFMDSKI